MTVVFVPHPDTQECRKHPGEFYDPFNECVRCATDRIVATFLDGLGRTAPSEAVSVKAAPAELYDLDLGREHWLRCDLYETVAQAKHAANRELEADWTQLRCAKVWARLDTQRADALADDVPEPYDGWPSTAATEDDEGAVAYWHVRVKRPARAAA